MPQSFPFGRFDNRGLQTVKDYCGQHDNYQEREEEEWFKLNRLGVQRDDVKKVGKEKGAKSVKKISWIKQKKDIADQ